MGDILPAVVIGGITYTLVKQSSDPIAPVGAATQYSPSYGTTLDQQLAGVKTAPPPPSGTVKATGSLTSKLRMVNAVSVNPLGPKGNWTSHNEMPANIDPELTKKLAELERYAEQQFNNMDEVARGKAADYLNKELKLDPPLTGHEDWHTVAAVAGGAAGAAAGTALCGPLCGKVGAMVGAYLGGKIEDYIEKNYDDMKAWLKSKWGDLKDEIEDLASDIKDAAGDALEFINPF